MSDEAKKSWKVPCPGSDQAAQSRRHSLRAAVQRAHRHRKADDLWAGIETPKDASIAHPVRLAAFPVSGKAIFL